MEELPMIEILLENNETYGSYSIGNGKSSLKYEDFVNFKEGDFFLDTNLKILKKITSDMFYFGLESIQDIYREEQAIKNKDMNDKNRIVKSWEWLYDLAGSAFSLELTEDEMLELIKDYVYDKDFKFVNNKNKEIKIYPYTIVFYASSDNREMYDEE